MDINDGDTIDIQPVSDNFSAALINNNYWTDYTGMYPFSYNTMKWGVGSGLKQFNNDGSFYIITREVSK